MSSPSRIWGKAAAEIEFGALYPKVNVYIYGQKILSFGSGGACPPLAEPLVPSIYLIQQTTLAERVAVRSNMALSQYVRHTFQFSDEPILVLDVPAFGLLLQDLLQHHKAATHQTYQQIQDTIDVYLNPLRRNGISMCTTDKQSNAGLSKRLLPAAPTVAGCPVIV